MITRYLAIKDNTITDAFDSSLTKRARLSNMGASDSLEVFYIANQAYDSVEKSRILIQFDVDSIINDRANNKLPDSGDVRFFLRMFNIEHDATLARKCKLNIIPVSNNWEEGSGLDMELYRDIYSSNWLYRTDDDLWTTPGGDFLESPSYSSDLDSGEENIELDITDLVENWISNDIPNNGICIKLSGSYETGSTTFYTKKYSARGTEYFFQRPTIEARWDDSILDNRYNFWPSSSLCSDENVNKIYLINRIRNNLVNIPAFESEPISVGIYDSIDSATPLYSSVATKIRKGVYSSEAILDTTASILFDKWFAGGDCYYTGSIYIKNNSNSDTYVSKIINLKPKYSSEEVGKFTLFTREYNWNPTIYVKSSSTIEQNIIEELHFSISRVADNLIVIDYDFDNNSTRLSYGDSGSYFHLDISLLEPGYLYEIRFKYKSDNTHKELPEKFRFRVG